MYFLGRGGVGGGKVKYPQHSPLRRMDKEVDLSPTLWVWTFIHWPRTLGQVTPSP